MIEDYLPRDRDGRLFRLVEEMGEVSAAIGKACRFGMNSVNPELPQAEQETNAAWLARELQDLKHAIAAVEQDLVDL